MHLAHRLNNIAPFHVMRVLEAARQLEAEGRSICHMEVGEPDFETAAPIMHAGQQALSRHLTKYTPAAGIPELRQSIADYYRKRFGVELPASRILVTPGASGGLQLLMGLLLDPGDEILLTDPGYPCNRHLALLVGAKPVALPVYGENGFQPDVNTVRKSWVRGRTRALLIASPSNPTGSVINRQLFRELHQCVTELGGIMVVDEIYQGLVYEQAAWTALEEVGNVIVLNSFSKYFGMTGWRIGWMVAPQEAMPALEKLAQNSYLSATTTSQYAALAAMTDEALAIHECRREAFRQRRDYLSEALSQLGFVLEAEPEGAFYLYANCKNIAGDASWLVDTLLSVAGVACTPGNDFGHNGADSHVRFAYTRSIDHMREGIERMRGSLPGIRQAWLERVRRHALEEGA